MTKMDWEGARTREKAHDGGSDSYRIVTAVLRVVRPRSFTVELPHQTGRTTLPRSLIHGGDDLKLDSARVDQEFTFRLRSWRAEEAGLA